MIISKTITKEDINIIPDSEESWLGMTAWYEVDCTEEEYEETGDDVLKLYTSTLIDVL
jgi:hypothetical protein